MANEPTGGIDEFYQPVTKGELVSLALAIRGITIPMLEYMVSDIGGRDPQIKMAAINKYIDANKEFSNALSRIASWMVSEDAGDGK